MYRLSVCAETIFCGLPFPQRVEAAARSGFLVEFWRRSGEDIDAIERMVATDPRVEIANLSGSSDGSMMHPDGVEAFLTGVGIQAVAAHPATRWITAYRTLCRVAELAEKHDVADHPGYALPNVEDTVRLVEQVGSPRIRILLDLYHAQVQQGNAIQALRDYRDVIGYIHVADAPGRHEPGTGEIDYPLVAQTLRDAGYGGFIGLEAYPLGDDSQALSRFRESFRAEQVGASR